MSADFSAAWAHPGKHIVLASRSPRRSRLLRIMGFTFTTVAPGIDDEDSFLDPADIEASLRRLAEEKARSVSRRSPASLVLGADTTVCCRGKILGKPSDAAEARSMLELLSGSRHTVYSAVCLVCEDDAFLQSAVEKTEVFFRRIHEDEIDAYIRCGEFIDKAGGYGIQGKAMVFVEGIEGCFYNVIGLPIVKTISLFNAYVHRKESSNG